MVLADVVLNSAQVSLSSETLLPKYPHLQPVFSHFQNFKRFLNVAGFFAVFMYSFGFLRQTRIPCRQNLNHIGIIGSYQTSLCIYRHLQSGLTGCITVYFLLAI